MTYTFKIAARLSRVHKFAVLATLLLPACADQLGSAPSEGSFTISPSTISGTIGSSQLLTAVLRDADGNPVDDASVTWSSDAPEIASISASGIMTAVGAGRTKIRGHSHGKTDTAVVVIVDTTTPPTPPDTTTLPPPPDTTTTPQPPVVGAWPHEPSGWTLITDNPFTLLSTLGWNVAWNDQGLASIVSDASAPTSPSSVLEMRYPVGFAGGSGPANVWHPLPNLHRMYTGFTWKANAGWDGHESNVNKILFAFPASGGDIYLAMYGPPGGPYQLRVLPQFAGMASNWLVPNVNNVPVTVGSWHKIEWVIDYGSGGSTGIVQWWMDGVLIGDHRNVAMPSGALIEFKINPTWGGAGDTKSSNDYFRYDHIRVSGN